MPAPRRIRIHGPCTRHSVLAMGGGPRAKDLWNAAGRYCGEALREAEGSEGCVFGLAATGGMSALFEQPISGSNLTSMISGLLSLELERAGPLRMVAEKPGQPQGPVPLFQGVHDRPWRVAVTLPWLRARMKPGVGNPRARTPSPQVWKTTLLDRRWNVLEIAVWTRSP